MVFKELNSALEDMDRMIELDSSNEQIKYD